MTLQNIPKKSKIYINDTDFLTFHHLDGLYSYLTDKDGNVGHLKFNTPLEEYEDGYKIINN